MAFPTKSLLLSKTSSQYASRADTGSTGLKGFNTDFTFESWVKFTSDVSSSSMTFCSKWNASISYLIRYYDVSGVKLLLSTTSDTGSGITISRFSTGVWYHIAAVLTKATSTQEWFINGNSQGSTSAGTVTSGTDPFHLGEDGGGGGYFDGNFCLARFWTTARTSAQLKANWNTELGATSGLSAEWTLDNTYNDNSGNGNTLTGVNSPVFVSDVPSFGGGIASFKTLLGVGK